MTVTVLQENLAQALASIQRLIPSKPTLPILSSVWLHATGTEITLGVTDLYLGILTKVPAEVSAEGTWAIPGKVFCETIAMMKPGKLTLSVSESTLKLVSADSQTTIQIQPADDYPTFPAIEGEQLILPTASLTQMLDQVSFAASADVSRPILTSLNCDFGAEQLTVVATDGFRLAKLVLPQTNSAVQHIHLPARALQEFNRSVIASDQDTITLTISQELKQVVATIGSVTLFTRLIEGEYPPYQKIIPSEFELEFLCDSSELMHQIKRALVFARESSQVVQLKIEPENSGKVTVIGVSPTAGTYTGTLDVEVTQAGSGHIAFNAKYVLDFLQAVKGQRIWFGMKESTKPAMFKIDGNQNYIYVVMPFRLSNQT